MTLYFIQIYIRMNYRFILSYIKNETIIQSVKQVLREQKPFNNNSTTIIYNNTNTNVLSKKRKERLR